MTGSAPRQGEIILCGTANDAMRVDVLYESESFWLDQKRIAELFGVEWPTISYHLKEVYTSGGLAREATLRKILRVQRDGDRDVRREIEFYNLDAIISVGYRVGGAQATQTPGVGALRALSRRSGREVRSDLKAEVRRIGAEPAPRRKKAGP